MTPTPKSDGLHEPPKALFGLHNGDARRLEDLLGQFSNEREPLLTCTITSPPYADLKNYGHPDQIGWGQPYDEYLAELRRVFRSVARHTRDDGCLWVVVDTVRPRNEHAPMWALEPLPFQLAEQISDVGWTFRDIIIWKKDKTRPWSSPGRLRNAFEYILFFVKSDRFKYHVDRLRETDRLEQWWVKWPERYNPQGKVPENVWEIPIPVQGQWASTAIQHACPLPPDLVERLLFLSTDEGDVVFDPFAGSGVVLAEAERLGRRPIGIELVKKYVAAYEKFVRPELLQRRGTDALVEHQRYNEWLHETIVKLRVLKYTRQILEGATRVLPDYPAPLFAIVLANPKRSSKAGKLVDAEIFVVSSGAPADLEDLHGALTRAGQRKPTSMFGVGATITVVAPDELPGLKRKTLHAYLNGKHYMTVGSVRVEDALDYASEHRGDRIPPILSNLKVSETPRPIEAPNGAAPAHRNGASGSNGSIDASAAVREAVESARAGQPGH